MPLSRFLSRTLACVLSLAAFSSGALAGPNLLTNPGAEAGPVGTSIPGWTRTGSFEVVSYAVGGGFPTASSPGSPNRGQKFFAGGDGSAIATASQTLSLSSLAAAIDAHTQTFTLSGWLGGFSSQNDHCDVAVTFRDGASGPLGSASIGNALASQRGSVTGMHLRTATGIIPAGTRSVTITVTMTRSEGSYNDGYADDLSFTVDSHCIGDLNGDALVDDADFSLFAIAYNILDCADPAMPAACPADFNRDGVVDDLDFSLFAVAYDALLCP
ncbi:MAG TPA: hypothetical protein VF777_14000 [Phycisphaerales bacterium]